MFDIKRQIKLKQAKNALRDGRIDEALAIGLEKDIREHREGQVLLERLVQPLLDRAAMHRDAGRLGDAALDVERAIAAGGHRADAVHLRREIQDALQAQNAVLKRQEALVISARAHIEQGSLRTGKEILRGMEGAPQAQPGVDQLLRRAEQRERKGEEARTLAEAHLERGELQEALQAAGEALQLCRSQNTWTEFLSRLKKTSMAALEGYLTEGNLRMAVQLQETLPPAIRDSLEARRLEDGLLVIQEAIAALERHQFETARAALGRACKLFPKVAWLEESAGELARISAGLQTLQASPLGMLPAALRRSFAGTTAPAAGNGARLPVFAERPEGCSGNRFLLWLDGVGSYLVLTSSRVSLGRLGASAGPDVAMASDIAGYHAEILRMDEDYFIVQAQGPVLVNGQATARKLLADGDLIELGSRCRLTFHLPSALAASAVLTLHKGQRMDGDVRDIILMNGNLLLGAGGNCHIAAPGPGEPAVLCHRDGSLVCRAREEILVDGKQAGLETPVEPGAHVQIGELTFTVTAASQGEN